MSQVDPAPPLVRRVARGAAALALGIAFLTACGGDSPGSEAADSTAEATEGTASESAAPTSGTETSSADAGETQTITATEADFSISLDEDSLSPGTYEIEVVNEGDGTHDLVVERDGEDVEASESIGPGESTTLTVTLEAGDYVFYCSIGNHRAMGMEIEVSVA